MTVQIIRPADRDAWLAARSQDVTASVAAAVLDAHPYTTRYQLWALKSGRSVPEDIDNDAMERGRYLEPVGVAMLRDRRPDWTVEYTADNTYYRDSGERIGATPDAFAHRPDRAGRGIVQIKSVAEGAFRDYWLDPDTGEVIPPDWIMVQAIVEAKLTNSPWACVAVLIITWRGTLRLEVVDIPLHDRLWQRLRAAVTDFWSVVDAREEPPIDWDRDGPVVLDVYRHTELDRKDLTADTDLDLLVRRYKQAGEQESAAKKLRETLRPQIIHALGNAEAGQTASWNISAASQHRDGFYVKPTSTRVLRIKPRERNNDDF